MTWSSFTGLICLLCCVVISAGRLSPPKNLSVTFLDFRGEVNWSTALGNQPGTRYTVEIQPIGEEWSQLETCTNVESSTCPLIFNLTMDALLESYNIRVKASWKGNSSNWTSLGTFQPYGNTLLSAPTLNVSVQERDIYVHIHMPQPVLSVLPNLQYNVQVSESNHNYPEKCVRLRGSSYMCKSLSLGQRYCVRASAIHRQQQTKPHLSSEKCVDLPGNTSNLSKHVAMATMLLVLVIIVLSILFMYLYTKPRPSDRYTPYSLEVVAGAGRTFTDIPAEAPSLLSLMCVINPSLGSRTTLQGYHSSCSWGYECRAAFSSPEQTADVPPLPAYEEELEEQHNLLHCQYSGALDEEQQGNGVLEGETHNTQPVSDKMDWQLDQGPLCLDVPMSSLILGLDSGEPLESCEESDSASNEGEKMDIGAKLLGQSQQNSVENLSSSLETLDKPCSLKEPIPNSTYPTGYESHPNPTPYELISPACAPSPIFGQSVLYLKR